MLKHVITLLVVVLAAVAVAPASSPVQLSYVYADSMEPTIDRYDGFVLVPAGTVEVGEIVTFWSPKRGEYATHRIVGQDERGYITKGDNNPTTDQSANYEYVTRDRIVGSVLTLNGQPVLVPGLGRVVSLLQSYELFVLSLAGAVVVGSSLQKVNGRSRPNRTLVRVSDLVQPVLVAAMVGLVALVLVGASTNHIAFVALDGHSDAPRALTVGESETHNFTVRSSSSLLTSRVVGTSGMTVVNQTRNETRIWLTARTPPPEERGAYRATVSVYQYPAVLPRSILNELSDVHPLFAASTSVTVAFAPFVLAYALFVDGGTPLRTVEPKPFRRSRRKRP